MALTRLRHARFIAAGDSALRDPYAAEDRALMQDLDGLRLHGSNGGLVCSRESAESHRLSNRCHR